MKPQCRCAERAEALKRLAAAKLSGDHAAASKEIEFIRTSTIEDMRALSKWMADNAAEFKKRIV